MNTPMSDEQFEQFAHRAGAALRRSAPSDAVGRVRQTHRRRQLGRAAIVVVSFLVVGVGAIALTRPDRRAVAPSATTTTSTPATTSAPSTTVASGDPALALTLTLTGLEGLAPKGDQQRMRGNGEEQLMTLWSGVDGIQSSYLKLLDAAVPGTSGPEGDIAATPITVPSGTAWLVTDRGDTDSHTTRIMWWRSDGRQWVVTQHGLTPERLIALTLMIQPGSGLPHVLPDPSMKFVMSGNEGDFDAIRQQYTLDGSFLELELASPGLVLPLNGAETSIAARVVRGQPGYEIALPNGQIDVTWPSGAATAQWFTLYISPPLASRVDEIVGALRPTTAATDTPLQAVARAYAEAVLHGSAGDVNATYSPVCDRLMTDTDLTQVRARIERAIGKPLADVHITSIETRPTSTDSGLAFVHFDIPATIEGNDNWLLYRVVAGEWRLSDCTMIPIGGNSQSSTPVTG